MSSTYGLHWFRRDLRVAGNPALQWSWREHRGRVLGFFCFDPVFLARPDFSPARFAFFLATLQELRKELRALGGDLLVLSGGPEAAFAQALKALKHKPATVSWNRDYEPFARQRDALMSDFFAARDITTHTERDHLLLEPGEVGKADGDFYKIYSPFARTWFAKLKEPELIERLKRQSKMPPKDEKIFSLGWKDACQGAPPPDSCEDFTRENAKQVRIPLPAAGSAAALAALKNFKKRVGAYKDKRDFPAEAGTSQLSIYLKNGSLNIAQIIRELDLLNERFQSGTGPATFLQELCWREFYYSILWHCPRVENEAFIEKYKRLKWSGKPAHLQAWKEGRTGFPIVDAGMRQLAQTGWMHNRVRMIVASFLVKDLLIDWREGERHFMQLLLDGDLAPNNGGWQWAASTGCDPQPYFRVFNPTLQGDRFDPTGEYVRRWLPEGSCAPIVDHAEQKAKAIALFKAV